MNPKHLMDAFQIDPKKSLGQNFLHDPNALDKIVASADLQAGDTVVEIGPGTGALTMRLASAAARVIAVEVDDRLLPILARQLEPYPNVEVVHADVLETNVAVLVGAGPYCVVANLPYYITSAILRHLLEVPHKPTRLVLTMQEEVAERLCAKPNDMSVLAVSVQYFGTPQIITRLAAAAFWPRPEVGSAVLRIDVFDQPPVAIPSEALFFRIVRAGFGQKRKQLKNSLGAGLAISNGEASDLLSAAGIDPMRRAETLTLEEWAAITGTIDTSAILKS